MEEVRRIRTACRSCHGGCGVIAHVKDGRVIKVEGDPNSLISHGTLCSKGLAITQLAYHPDRVLVILWRLTMGIATDHRPVHSFEELLMSQVVSM
jgi:anaerobic selenocysteine-containing dehydrogenase